MIRSIILGLLAALMVLAATAEETINQFDVFIDVRVNGDIQVTEIIKVQVEGRQIKRGIFRDFPRYMTDGGVKMPVDYSIRSVERDGKRENYTTTEQGNALQLRIGNEHMMLEPREHIYEIRYVVKNQIRYQDDQDELYWNATGSYWAFPILASHVEISLPPGANVTAAEGYTGRRGHDGKDYRYIARNGRYVFDTTKPLASREGFTIALGIEKGVIDPPSTMDRFIYNWQRYGALGILALGFMGVFGYYRNAFNKVGRDPPRLPVFARYAPPEGYSPGAVQMIFNRMVDAQRAFISTMVYMGTLDQIEIDASSKKSTKLTRTAGAAMPDFITKEDRELVHALFKKSAVKEFGGSTDSGFVRTLSRYAQKLSRVYGDKYFKWNALYTLSAIALSIGAVAIAIWASHSWGLWHMLLVGALVVLNGWFMYLMPAPTPIGEEVRSEIAGFKLYLETAEKLQMNAVEVGSDQPPPMSTALYQKFLPYAIALNVEKPWSKYFENVLPTEAREFSPSWSSGNWARGGSSKMASSMVSNMSSGVSSATPQSSGSSGSSGGGSSGGGGGGGGGGGW